MPDPIQGVNTTDPVTAASTTQNTATTPTGSASASAVGAAGSDVADVAQTEALLQSIVQAANNVPGIDQAKVTELQQAIASGNYQANPQSIAQNLVELEALLVTAGQVQ
jgi:flagellar biosynthesis anti-sigma factor FlgM